MKMFYYYIIGIILILINVSNVHSDAVCDLSTLIVELKQDLADNGMLDCLRVIEPPHFVEETELQKNLRLAAQWDTSCSFESSSNWLEPLKKNYGISFLVDSTGENVAKDFADQADMCEIIRAAVSQNLFDIRDLNMQNIPDDTIDKIDCAGVINSERSGPRICAVSGGSFFQQDSWTIFLDTISIKFGGKPDFTIADNEPLPTENPFKSSANPRAQAKLIKDLMKFSKDQLDLRQGELANMIDKSEQEAGSMPKNAQEKDIQNESSRHAHVHVKRIKEVTFMPSKKFALVDGGSNKFKMDKSRIVFAFYMVTVKFEKQANAFFKLKYANREISESRQAIGETNLNTLTGAFGEVYAPTQQSEEINLEVLYETSELGNVSTDSGEQNFSFGAITLPLGSVFKKINSGNLEFHKSEVWNLIPNFDLTIKFTDKEPAYFIIMYNLAFPLPGLFTLETRLRLGQKAVQETSVQCGPTNVIGVHSGMALRIQPGSTQLALEYKYDGGSVLLSDFTDAHYVQSITAFQLPSSADVKNFRVGKPFTLNTFGEWQSFNLDAGITLTRSKTVLIIYNINLKVEKANFIARIRNDNKYNKKSIYTVNGQNFAYAQGYVVLVMKEGHYNFDIDFKSDSGNTFNPDNSELDGQIVNLQIILLD